MSLASIETERSLIGAALLEPKRIPRLTETVTPKDFSEYSHQIVWREMVNLANKGVHADVVSVSDALEAASQLETVGGLAYLAGMVQETPSAANAAVYADIVFDLSQRRRLITEADAIRQLASDRQTEFSSAVDSAQGRLSRLIREDADQAGPIGGELAGLIDEIDAKWNGHISPMGMSFGLDDLDDKTMGMFPGNMVVIAGRPGMGKTAKALNVLRATCVQAKRPAVMFSMEMDRKALLQRLTAATADIPLQAVRDPRNHMTDDCWARLAPAVAQIKDAPLVVDDRAGMTPSQIRASAKRWKDHYGDMGLVVVDYLQLMASDGNNKTRDQEVGEASRTMKLLAKELKCPVIVLSQLNRSLESRTNKRPVMSDLRESGAIEQDADLILFLYRDEVYNPESDAKGTAEIIIGKQREGSLATVYAAARLDRGRFDNLSADAVTAAKEAWQKPKQKPRSAMDCL